MPTTDRDTGESPSQVSVSVRLAEGDKLTLPGLTDTINRFNQMMQAIIEDTISTPVPRDHSSDNGVEIVVRRIRHQSPIEMFLTITGAGVSLVGLIAYLVGLGNKLVDLQTHYRTAKAEQAGAQSVISLHEALQGILRTGEQPLSPETLGKIAAAISDIESIKVLARRQTLSQEQTFDPPTPGGLGM